MASLTEYSLRHSVITSQQLCDGEDGELHGGGMVGGGLLLQGDEELLSERERGLSVQH